MLKFIMGTTNILCVFIALAIFAFHMLTVGDAKSGFKIFEENLEFIFEGEPEND